MVLEVEDSGPLRIGDTFLEKYEIRRLIGRGGHARVYHGHYSWGRRDVAIKTLHREGGLTAEMRHRGQTEAQILMNELKHPNIVEVADAGIHQGILYIIMELLRGRTLRDVLIEHGRLDTLEVFELFGTVAETIAFAHQKGVVHRDLKPENVFVARDNVPKVLDFGIAKIMGAGGWQTQRHQVIGTTLYMAPEQILGQSPSPKSDVYALGVMLFEATLGRHPCLLENSSMDARVLAGVQVHYRPPRVDALDPAIPAYLADLIHQATNKRPEQRFSTMEELARQLHAGRERYLQHAKRSGVTPACRDLSRAGDAPDENEDAARRSPPPSAPRPPASEPVIEAADTAVITTPSFVPLGKQTLLGIAPASLVNPPARPLETGFGERAAEAKLELPPATSSRPASVHVDPLARVAARRATPATPQPLTFPPTPRTHAKQVRRVALIGSLAGFLLFALGSVWFLSRSSSEAENAARPADVVVQGAAHEPLRTVTRQEPQAAPDEPPAPTAALTEPVPQPRLVQSAQAEPVLEPVQETAAIPPAVTAAAPKKSVTAPPAKRSKPSAPSKNTQREDSQWLILQ